MNFGLLIGGVLFFAIAVVLRKTSVFFLPFTIPMMITGFIIMIVGIAEKFTPVQRQRFGARKEEE